MKVIKTTLKASLICVSFILLTSPAYAYVGPGMGLGAIGLLIGIVGSILVGIFAVVYYPIKHNILCIWYLSDTTSCGFCNIF